ncbi:peptide/nickel transport system permease protein [Paenarthrobacter nicotinovorans]|jgi:peptide/nickel transport system permease protein|uniref:Peptide/nickel transport system permease protein n=1 Tax=Paenarthrobacter nicotinovorans TaxID=29320 RepID=A0ABT9TT14_PAENI|nr:ABC transporter permease [Paenarthrobacter nicotinovorans]MDQ0104369.1 peptide/nickel transport system permease protein [Paenarthrobacter nicotinovorans]GAT88268.1 ABC transporter permease [Paenarthrobacter nicotinovorans]
MTSITLKRRIPLGALHGTLSTTISIGVILVVLLATLLAPVIAPADPNQGDLLNTLAAPSISHPLGTDSAGRDVLSRLMHGGGTSLLGPLIIVLISTIIGTAMGLLAGYLGGAIDMILTRIWDLILSFPSLILAILLVAAFGPGYWSAVGALAFLYAPILSRVVRSAVLAERGKAYVEAARVQGFSGPRIAFGHILPNVLPGITAQATLNFGFSLLELAGLTFLGLGVQPPQADWGQMLLSGKEALAYGSFSEVIAASAVIVAMVVAFNITGEAFAKKAEGKQ